MELKLEWTLMHLLYKSYSKLYWKINVLSILFQSNNNYILYDGGKSIMELETEGYEKCKRCFVENNK